MITNAISCSPNLLRWWHKTGLLLLQEEDAELSGVTTYLNVHFYMFAHTRQYKIQKHVRVCKQVWTTICAHTHPASSDLHYWANHLFTFSKFIKSICCGPHFTEYYMTNGVTSSLSQSVITQSLSQSRTLFNQLITDIPISKVGLTVNSTVNKTKLVQLFFVQVSDREWCCY